MAHRWDRLDPRSTVRMQETLLRSLIRQFLYPFSPFYRSLFDEAGIRPKDIRGLRDLHRIPLVSAKDFDATPEDGWRPFRVLLRPEESSLKRSVHRQILRRVAKEKLFRGDQAAESLLAEEFKPVHLQLPDGSGPVAGYTMRDLSALSQGAARSFAVAGARRSDVLASTLPFGPSLPFWHGYYGAIGSGMSALHLGGGAVVRPAQVASWMEKVSATVLLAQPGYAEGLLRGAPPSTLASLRLLLLWSPTVMQGARERYLIRLRTGGAPEARVATLLGIPEARVAWAECPVSPDQPEVSFGYHTYPDLELLEVVDEHGSVVEDGQGGELVYTSLDWRGSALLRYRTGIVARRGITWERCPGCRRTVPRIEPDLSRVEWRTRVAGPRGEVTVDIADVIPILWRSAGVALWQLEVQKGAGPGGTDRVIAYLGGSLTTEAEELRHDLEPYGIETRVVDFPRFTRAMGVGLERAEVRVRVREAGPAPAPEPPDDLVREPGEGTNRERSAPNDSRGDREEAEPLGG